MPEVLTTYLPFLIHAQDRVPPALVALAIVSVAGGLAGARGAAIPAYWKAVLLIFGGLGRRLDKRERSRPDLLMRGFILTAVALLLSLILGQAAVRLCAAWPTMRMPEILFLATTLASGGAWRAVFRLERVLSGKDDRKGAYYTISRTARVDLSAADDHAIARAAINVLARLFDKGLAAPLFWYLLGGLRGAFLYACLAALVWRFGRDGFDKGFGAFPRGLERITGFVPSVFAGLLIAVAGFFTPGGSTFRGILGLARRKGAAPYAEGGAPLTAMAYALNMGLGGPAVDIDGSALQRAWAGPSAASARLRPDALKRAVYICVMAALLLAAATGGLAFAF